MAKKDEPTLSEIKKQLEARGASPIDYKHLSYEQLKKLAGY
ncbi:hypothetical protein [Cytobacillus praedii]|nr:hypothetical protein [Cytobacillus praedii]